MTTSVFTRSLKKLSSMPIKTNVTQGSYRPRFFDLEQFGLSRIDFNSFFYQNSDVEAEIIKGLYSFCYLREDKLRTIISYNTENQIIPFDLFLEHFHITVNSSNLFKTGKYLSRVFRPVRYGSFYKDLDIYINENHNYKHTDGLSLISLRLAHSLGYNNAKPGMSVQITVFSSLGLLKGNSIISDKIEHDVVIYSKESLKEELILNAELQYVTIEPLKLGKILKLDIQTLVNLWNLFGGEQYLLWANVGIEKYISDLTNGRLNQWLDDFEDLDNLQDYNKEQWTLRKAIWRGIDYRNYPGLMRLAWTNFRTSIRNYGENNGQPVFRIPVPSGRRGYLRVDLREHDKDGNFVSTVEPGKVVLDKFGNIWISSTNIEEYLQILGGADQDDSAGVIPLSGGKSLLYRNPNAYGEYVITNIHYDGVEVTDEHTYITQVIRPILDESKVQEPQTHIENKLYEKFLSLRNIRPDFRLRYDKANLLRNYIRIVANQTTIGSVCNAEMIRSAIGIHNSAIHQKLMKDFPWDIERVIDSTVKSGISAEEDLTNVAGMYKYVSENKIKVSQSLAGRLPQMWRSEIPLTDIHELDELLEALDLLIKQADYDVLGAGSVNRGNRKPGLIDACNVPLIELGKTALDNPFYDLSFNILKDYNREMAILLENSKGNSVNETIRSEGIKLIQEKLIKKMSRYSKDERALLINTISYEIYKSSGFTHDSILWIGDQAGLQGTAEDMFNMLANTGKEAYHINMQPELVRNLEIQEAIPSAKSLRLWSNKVLDPKVFAEARELFICNKKAHFNDQELNIGDECKITDGHYQITAVAPCISRKKQGKSLRNSLMVYFV